MEIEIKLITDGCVEGGIVRGDITVVDARFTFYHKWFYKAEWRPVPELTRAQTLLSHT